MKINMQIYSPFGGKVCIYLVATIKWLKHLLKLKSS